MNFDKDTRKRLLLGGPEDGEWFVGNSSAAFESGKCYSMINVQIKQTDDGHEAVQEGDEIYIGEYTGSSPDNRIRHQPKIDHSFKKKTVTTPIQYADSLNESQVRFKITECKENNALGGKKKTYRKRVSKKRKQNKKKKTKRRKH